MNDYESPVKVPKWRIAVWALLIIGAFAWVAYALGDRGIMWAGVICVPVVVTLMLGIIRLARTQWARQHLGQMIWIYVILQSALLVWRLLERK